MWSLGPMPAGLEEDLAATGAGLVVSDLDPLADLIRVQRLAVAHATSRGLDPDRPRNLVRSATWRGRSGVSSATAASAPGLEATTEPLAGKGIVIGADVGGTFVKAAVTGPERAMRRRIDKPTRAEDGREPVVEAVVRRPGALAQGLAGSARRGVGDSLFLVNVAFVRHRSHWVTVSQLELAEPVATPGRSSLGHQERLDRRFGIRLVVPGLLVIIAILPYTVIDAFWMSMHSKRWARFQ